ncbi:hypothetical protein KIPB_004662, partial [Kipferlia bialata]|eukprot:g4662.t1
MTDPSRLLDAFVREAEAMYEPVSFVALLEESEPLLERTQGVTLR